MTTPFIVMSAPNGARRGKADHPALPLAPDEIATCAEQVADAGASIIHLHVRDKKNEHSLDPVRYRAAINAIHERIGDRLIIQVTTEACGRYSVEQQMAMARELRPEAVSLALSELCPNAGHESVAAEFFTELKAHDIMSQYILYSPEDVARFGELRRRGVIPDARPFVLFVLGRYSESLTGDPGILGRYVEELQADVTWMVCCFGSTENQAVIEAATSSGHVRVGFENNLVMPDGTVAPDNAALIKLAAISGIDENRHVANADDVRRMLF